MQLTYITPSTHEELSEHREVLWFLCSFAPEDVCFDLVPFVDDLMEYFAGFLTLVYSGKLVIGFYVLYPVLGRSKRSYDIHGVYRQDLKLIFGRQNAKVLMDHIFSGIFQRVFLEAGKDKVVAKVTPKARTARIWLHRYGFERVNAVERNAYGVPQTIWKLERDKYLGVIKHYG